MSSGLLCVCAKAGQADRVEILLDASAIVDVVDHRGYSALMCACENTSTIACGAALVESGANVNFVVVRTARVLQRADALVCACAARRTAE
jgi:ankyrin repeat protein